MKNKNPNAERVWKQFEDLLVPRLRLSVIDRAVYSHLVRHSRLEGKLRLRISISRIARGARLGRTSVQRAVRRLVGQGALRIVERGRAGHLIEVRLPDEIRVAREPAQLPPPAFNLEEIDFIQTRALRQAIHAREDGLCFYCLRRLAHTAKCLDHVMPQAQMGCNSYRNLVSCCMECNSQKAEKPAGDFLRSLYRDGRLTAVELTGRLRALEALASGKLPPPLNNQGDTGSKGSREVKK